MSMKICGEIQLAGLGLRVYSIFAMHSVVLWILEYLVELLHPGPLINVETTTVNA